MKVVTEFCGFNPNLNRYSYFLSNMYTRVREDREGKKGTTPTKYKIPIAKLFSLPQLHPAVDIPYTLAGAFSVSFMGKRVIVDHKEDANTIGYIAFSNLTSNPVETISPCEDENSTHEGKPITYHNISGVLGIEKNKINLIVKMKRVRDFTELDNSIGFWNNFEVDEGDTVWEKDEDGEELYIDFYKSKCYATGFKPEEISILGRGEAACLGAGIRTQLKKRKHFSTNMMKILMKCKRSYSLRPNPTFLPANWRMILFSVNYRRSFRKPNKILSDFSNSEIEKLKNINKDLFFKKKREYMEGNKETAQPEGSGDVIMGETTKKPETTSENLTTTPSQEATKDLQTPSTETTLQDQQGDAIMKETPNPVEEKQPNKEQQLNKEEKQSPQKLGDELKNSEDFELVKTHYGFKTEQDFAEFGKRTLLQWFKQEKEYIQQSSKDYPGFKKDFVSCCNYGKDEKDVEMFDNDTDEKLKDIYTKPMFMELKDYMNKIVQNFQKITRENSEVKKNVQSKISSTPETDNQQDIFGSLPGDKGTNLGTLIRSNLKKKAEEKIENGKVANPSTENKSKLQKDSTKSSYQIPPKIEELMNNIQRTNLSHNPKSIREFRELVYGK